MAQNSILKLVYIFKTKVNIYKHLLLLLRPLKTALGDMANVYSDEFQGIVVEKRPFREKTGLLPMIERLIQLNQEFLGMKAEMANLDGSIVESYNALAEVIEAEQQFLEPFLKPTLQQIASRQDYKEDWKKNLAHFQNFLTLLKADRQRFQYLLLEIDEAGLLDSSLQLRENRRKVMLANFIRALKVEDFVHARSYIEDSRSQGWFRGEELFELSLLVSSIEAKNVIALKHSVNSNLFKQIFDKENGEFFVKTLKDLISKYGIPKQQIDLQPVKIRGSRIWSPRVRRYPPTFMGGFRRFSIGVIIGSLLASALLGALPTRASTGSIRLKTNQEIARIVVPGATQQQIEAMTRATSFIDQLTETTNAYRNGDINYDDVPDYIREMISDGILDIAVFTGAAAPGEMASEQETGISSDILKTITFAQRRVVLHIRYVTNKQQAKQAFKESDVIYVNAHSGYGIGWRLEAEGMGNPFMMQTRPVRIPKNELFGYRGPRLKDLGNDVIVQTSDEDINQVSPRQGYQLIVMNSCNSGRHFLDVISRMRQGLPTTVIYTTTSVYSNMDFGLFMSGLLSLNNISMIVQELNSQEIKQENMSGEERLEPPSRMGVYYEAVVLNAPINSPESTQYDQHNTPNTFTLFYDVPR